jgi:hypothetical protein
MRNSTRANRSYRSSSSFSLWFQRSPRPRSGRKFERETERERSDETSNLQRGLSLNVERLKGLMFNGLKVEFVSLMQNLKPLNLKRRQTLASCMFHVEVVSLMQNLKPLNLKLETWFIPFPVLILILL